MDLCTTLPWELLCEEVGTAAEGANAVVAGLGLADDRDGSLESNAEEFRVLKIVGDVRGPRLFPADLITGEINPSGQLEPLGLRAPMGALKGLRESISDLVEMTQDFRGAQLEELDSRSVAAIGGAEPGSFEGCGQARREAERHRRAAGKMHPKTRHLPRGPSTWRMRRGWSCNHCCRQKTRPYNESHGVSRHQFVSPE